MTAIRIPVRKALKSVNDCIESGTIRNARLNDFDRDGSEPLSEKKIREAMHQKEMEEHDLFDEIPAF